MNSILISFRKIENLWDPRLLQFAYRFERTQSIGDLNTYYLILIPKVKKPQ